MSKTNGKVEKSTTLFHWEANLKRQFKARAAKLGIPMVRLMHQAFRNELKRLAMQNGK